MSTSQPVEPFHLQGNFAPVERELTATNLPVEGALPPELSGLYARQTPNPVTGTSQHWFMGDGMVHGVRLERGRATWYGNRYVKTPYLANPDVKRISDRGEIDRKVSKANTHVLRHAGRILALEEGSFPYVLDSKLETVGCTDFDGKLRTAFTAHPKLCPVTGELLAFGYGQLPPYLTYLRVSPDGRLVQSEEIEVGGPTMMHDFAITERHVLFMDLPVVFSLEDALRGEMPFAWSDDYPARIGVMPRTGRNADVRWFSVQPCYVFHTLNAFDEGDSVVLDACRNSEVWRKAGDMQSGTGKLTLHRFRFDLASGMAKEETLDDRPMEFPRVADAMVGRKNRFGFTLGLDTGVPGTPGFAGHLKVDLASGRSELHDYGPGRSAGEAVFVPAEGADPDSDNGYLLTYVYDEATRSSELVVVDASRMTKPAIARVKLPQRVPNGFHGSWMAD
jgi:carotenoid cleavage dioxygenase